MTARYVIGIDLGTTNCALSYADLELEKPKVHNFPILQLVEAGTTEERETLPSFHYSPGEYDLKEGSLALPWSEENQHTVGTFARDHGASRTQGLISSSKSWLCHTEVDRRAKILPFEVDDDEELIKYSPVTVAQHFLEHLKSAWNNSEIGEDAPLKDQEIFLTVPASFDAVARELTVEAAKAAGFADIVLLEEPLAAFYAWLYSTGENWRKELKVGDSVLICDIGGGTTDFSLIEAREASGDLELERVSVGEHILLGGDNMDLALAQIVSRKIKAKKKKLKLNAWQSRSLWYKCREAKEKLLSNPDLDAVPITILNKGSKLIGKTIKSELTQEEIKTILLDGFFPDCALTDEPNDAHDTGLRELGLPYAKDPAITKHVAAFLNRDEDDPQLPSALLVNGGVFKGEVLQSKLHEVLGKWSKEHKKDAPRLLASSHLDLAVATGAAYYGLARKGSGIRVKGGTARSYYIGIESNMPAVPGFDPPINALCVVPFGMEAGAKLEVPKKEFSLVIGQAVKFRLYSSVQRQEDKIGEVVEVDEGDLDESAPLTATLEASAQDNGKRTIPVRLQSEVTEIGTLDFCDGDRNLKLSFNIRDSEES
ncbi:MAG: Hsp70 family protein [Planctomycetota bacterium]|nr:Hsp70 family protein [Planctomycetota bacterium]